MFNLNFAYDWVRTGDIWCRKQPLNQLTAQLGKFLDESLALSLPLSFSRCKYIIGRHTTPVAQTLLNNHKKRPQA